MSTTVPKFSYDGDHALKKRLPLNGGRHQSGTEMTSILKLFFTAFLLAALPGAVEAADIQAGRQVADTQCRTCHGIDGIAQIPVAPHLAGESEIYLQTQLKAFRSGKRVNEMMNVVAKGLTDDDIANVAAWYSAIKIRVEMPE